MNMHVLFNSVGQSAETDIYCACVACSFTLYLKCCEWLLAKVIRAYSRLLDQHVQNVIDLSVFV